VKMAFADAQVRTGEVPPVKVALARSIAGVPTPCVPDRRFAVRVSEATLPRAVAQYPAVSHRSTAACRVEVVERTGWKVAQCRVCEKILDEDQPRFGALGNEVDASPVPHSWYCFDCLPAEMAGKVETAGVDVTEGFADLSAAQQQTLRAAVRKALTLGEVSPEPLAKKARTVEPSDARDAKVLEPCCPAGHLLVDLVAEDGYYCSVCEGDVEQGALMCGCRVCDYDVCNSCKPSVAHGEVLPCSDAGGMQDVSVALPVAAVDDSSRIMMSDLLLCEQQMTAAPMPPVSDVYRVELVGKKGWKWAQCKGCKNDIVKHQLRLGWLHGPYGAKPYPGGKKTAGNCYSWWCLKCVTPEQIADMDAKTGGVCRLDGFAELPTQQQAVFRRTLESLRPSKP